MLLGHSDVLMGAVCTNNAEFAEKMKFLQLGTCVCYYVLDDTQAFTMIILFRCTYLCVCIHVHKQCETSIDVLPSKTRRCVNTAHIYLIITHCKCLDQCT